MLDTKVEDEVQLTTQEDQRSKEEERENKEELRGITQEEEKRVVDKVTIYLVPFLSVLYLLCFLDRANLGNAHTEYVYLLSSFPLLSFPSFLVFFFIFHPSPFTLSYRHLYVHIVYVLFSLSPFFVILLLLFYFYIFVGFNSNIKYVSCSLSSSCSPLPLSLRFYTTSVLIFFSFASLLFFSLPSSLSPSLSSSLSN